MAAGDNCALDDPQESCAPINFILNRGDARARYPMTYEVSRTKTRATRNSPNSRSEHRTLANEHLSQAQQSR